MTNQSSGQQQLARQFASLKRRAEKSGQTVMTAFLTPSQQELARQVFASMPYRLEGGNEQALRKMLVAGEGHEEQEGCTILYSPLDPRYDPICHRDVLGALMHAGIERDVIGDIIVQPDGVFVACLEHMAQYAADGVVRIKRQSIHFQPCPKEEMPAPRFSPVRIIVASRRLDAVVAALAHCSRSKAAQMIAASMVKVNDVFLETGKTLCNNDCVSIRRTGKFRFVQEEKTTRKGNFVLLFDRYE